jgi:hypothetical protein
MLSQTVCLLPKKIPTSGYCGMRKIFMIFSLWIPSEQPAGLPDERVRRFTLQGKPRCQPPGPSR